MNKKYIILTSILLTLFIFIHIAEVESLCIPGTNMSGCGVLINVAGHGAVELCNNCFQCGIEDGVCPAWYSTGEIRTGDFHVELRKGTIDRPGVVNSVYSLAYNTATSACAQFGGTVGSIQRKSTTLESWGNVGLANNFNVANYDYYVRASCENVPRTPSCDTCIDLDCVTQVRGLAYTNTSLGENIVENAIIEIIPKNPYQKENETYTRSNRSNAQGEYSLEAYSGEVIVLCAALGYESMRKEITLKPGINIVDCKLGHGTCDSACTIPSAVYGQRVCSAQCQDENGCDFGSETAENLCDNRVPGQFVEINSTKTETEIIITGINCCNTPTIRRYPLFNIYPQSDISNLLTRTYRKQLPDGTPLNINIIAYIK